MPFDSDVIKRGPVFAACIHDEMVCDACGAQFLNVPAPNPANPAEVVPAPGLLFVFRHVHQRLTLCMNCLADIETVLFCANESQLLDDVFDGSDDDGAPTHHPEDDPEFAREMGFGPPDMIVEADEQQADVVPGLHCSSKGNGAVGQRDPSVLADGATKPSLFLS